MGGDQAQGGNLRPGQGAETVQGVDAVQALEPRFRGRGFGQGAGHGLDHAPRRLQRRAHRLVGEQAVGDQDLGGLDRRQGRGQTAHLNQQAFHLAGGELGAGHRRHAAAHGDGRQAIGAAGVQQPVLGQGARGDDAHHVAAHHRLAAAFPGLGGVFHLLADGDLEAGPDQLGQVGLRRVRRHPGHGDRRAGMGAAMGQGDADGGRSAGGVVEEQLVEIAHAEEHQGVGLARLGLEILRHHRRGAGGVRRGGLGRENRRVHRRQASAPGGGVETDSHRRPRESTRSFAQGG